MEHLESMPTKEQSHGTKLETVTKENCSATKSPTNGQSGRKSTTNPDRLQEASTLFAKKVSSEECFSDRTVVETSQKASRPTSELPSTVLGTDVVQKGSHVKTSRTGGSVLLPETRRRPFSYNFAGTRHESCGNLGIASLAGLSSTSATLALLPLQASGQSRTTTLPSPPMTTSSVVTSSPPLANMVSSSGTTSLDLSGVGHGRKLGDAASGAAASVRDRRSTFFSEPPKPISLPTRSATELSSLCDEGLSSGLQMQTNISSRGSKESNGPSVSVMSAPISVSGSFSSLSTATALETQSSSLSLLHQQEHMALAAESSRLCPDMSHTVSAQRDVSSVQFRDQSATSMSDSEDTTFSVWCGPPPDDAAALEPASTLDPCIFELESADVFSSRNITEELSEALAQALPSGSSGLVTPAKVGNIQKLKAFFGETTPRIIEGKTDSKMSGEMLLQGADTSVDPVDRRSDAVGDATKQMSATLVEQTTKGKKMATWALTSRHHNSHPQLPSTRPKKALPDREPSLSPKQKEHRKWKGKVVRKFKRHSSSSAVVMPSQPDEITGTFGIPLECCCPSLANEYVPLVVEVCTQVVEERGLANQGIYRVPGNSLAINNLVEELNRDPENASPDNEKWQDVNSVSSLLKLFFRKLPDSLITDELYECVIAINRTENSERRMLKLKKLLHELPEHNFETFRFLAQHLNKVATREEQNKMDEHNLAIMFGPTLVRPQDSSILVMARDNADQCRIVESIVTHCEWFFSSWDEDVNVPVDEVPTDPVPISGMNELLLAKAESLATDTSTHRDRLLSLIHAANKKLRLRDKSKSVESDPFVPSIASRSKSTTHVHHILNAAEADLPQSRPANNTSELAVSVRRYPAYHFDANQNAKTENCKPLIMRRVARSFESLDGIRTCIPANSSHSGYTLPMAYRSLNS